MDDINANPKLDIYIPREQYLGIKIHSLAPFIDDENKQSQLLTLFHQIDDSDDFSELCSQIQETIFPFLVNEYHILPKFFFKKCFEIFQTIPHCLIKNLILMLFDSNTLTINIKILQKLLMKSYEYDLFTTSQIFSLLERLFLSPDIPPLLEIIPDFIESDTINLFTFIIQSQNIVFHAPDLLIYYMTSVMNILSCHLKYTNHIQLVSFVLQQCNYAKFIQANLLDEFSYNERINALKIFSNIPILFYDLDENDIDTFLGELFALNYEIINYSDEYGTKIVKYIYICLSLIQKLNLFEINPTIIRIIQLEILFLEKQEEEKIILIKKLLDDSCEEEDDDLLEEITGWSKEDFYYAVECMNSHNITIEKPENLLMIKSMQLEYSNMEGFDIYKYIQETEESYIDWDFIDI